MPDTSIQLSQSDPKLVRLLDRGDGSFALAVANPRGPLSDHSGVTDGSDHAVVPANPVRGYLFVQNNDASRDIWINFATPATATQPSIRLVPGASMTWELGFIPTDALHAIGASGATYTCKEG